ncbi:uncharacterized protein PV07_07228 [Cladophialophora immunda]|uniref:Uncharacterized protein n=1 Tax=Cladophialophora immunda TaxID=569365 RepID=A0A0D2CAN4_9EURO|nr:uncharacterized protein PV07_07228 [Cladophialophora immunda]KIW27495.1 hypothetical protein PV07_07228 [Cladophialophora immunda]
MATLHFPSAGWRGGRKRITSLSLKPDTTPHEEDQSRDWRVDLVLKSATRTDAAAVEVAAEVDMRCQKAKKILHLGVFPGSSFFRYSGIGVDICQIRGLSPPTPSLLCTNV